MLLNYLGSRTFAISTRAIPRLLHCLIPPRIPQTGRHSRRRRCLPCGLRLAPALRVAEDCAFRELGRSLPFPIQKISVRRSRDGTSSPNRLIPDLLFLGRLPRLGLPIACERPGIRNELSVLASVRPRG